MGEVYNSAIISPLKQLTVKIRECVCVSASGGRRTCPRVKSVGAHIRIRVKLLHNNINKNMFVYYHDSQISLIQLFEPIY